MKKIKALIWKEWREARLFVIVALLLICVVRIVCGIFLTSEMKQDSFMVMSNLVFPVFASMIATIQGCREFEKETRLFLVSRPVSPLTTVSIKFLTGLVLMIVIVCIAHAAFLPSSLYELNNQNYIFFNMFREIGEGRFIKPVMLFFFMTTLYSSLFFTSLLIRKTLASIFITPILTLLLCLFLFMPIVLILMASSNITTALTWLFILISTVYTLSSIYVWIKNSAKSAAMWKVLLRIVTAWAIIGVCGALCYTYIYFSTSRELERTVAEAKKAGILLEPSELSGPAVPDSQNAALIYKKGFSSAKRLYDIFSSKYGNEKEIAKLFLTHKAELDKLFTIIDKATEYPECKFNISYDCIDFNFGPSSYISKMSYLNSLRIKYAFQSGNKEEGIKAVYSGFALANSLCRCSDSLSQFNRIRCIKEIIDALDDVPATSISVANYIKWMRKTEMTGTEINHVIIVEISSAYYLYIKNITGRKNTIYQGLWNPIERFLYECHLATPAIRKKGIDYLKRNMQQMEHINEPYWKVKDKFISPRHDTKLIQYLILWDGYADYFSFKAHLSVKTELYKTFFALKAYKLQHGKYPAKLAELVPGIISEVPIDPLSGKELVYRRDKDGFIFYSVGWNMKDDGGRINDKTKNDDITLRCTQ